MNKKKIARIEVRISPDVKDEFAVICNETGETASEAIRDFVHKRVNPPTDLINDSANVQGLTRKGNLYLLCLVIILLLSGLVLYYPTQPENEFQRKEFNSYDRDGNGILTVDDFQMLKANRIKNIVSGRSKVKLDTFIERNNPQKQFAKFDTNKDKKVTFSEFIESSKNNYRVSWGKFSPIDTDNNKLLDSYELYRYARKMLSNKVRADEIAAKLVKFCLKNRDKNDDGLLTIDEFHDFRVLTTQP